MWKFCLEIWSQRSPFSVICKVSTRCWFNRVNLIHRNRSRGYRALEMLARVQLATVALRSDVQGAKVIDGIKLKYHRTELSYLRYHMAVSVAWMSTSDHTQSFDGRFCPCKNLFDFLEFYHFILIPYHQHHGYLDSIQVNLRFNLSDPYLGFFIHSSYRLWHISREITVDNFYGEPY